MRTTTRIDRWQDPWGSIQDADDPAAVAREVAAAWRAGRDGTEHQRWGQTGEDLLAAALLMTACDQGVIPRNHPGQVFVREVLAEPAGWLEHLVASLARHGQEDEARRLEGLFPDTQMGAWRLQGAAAVAQVFLDRYVDQREG